MPEPSAEVVRRAQRGDEAALVELVSSQARYVYSIALSVVGNTADAADVTQDTVVRLLRSLSTYRGEVRFTTWLYRLVYNLALDHLRRTGRRAASLDQSEAEGYYEIEDRDPLVDPAACLDQRETAARVRAGLQLLPAIQRAALTMYYFDELRYEEIAEALELPLNTVKSHIRRAKLRMAQMLNERDVVWTAGT